MGVAEAFALLAGFCCEIFSGGFLFDSLFGFDGSADSFGTDAVCVAFGFGVCAIGGAGSVEARVGGAVAADALFDLTIGAAAIGAAGFGASARGGAELVETGADGAVASDALSGLTIWGTAVWAAGFGVPAGCAASVEVGLDGAVVIGAPSGPILCVATGVAG